MSDEQGERFHQDMRHMEERYQGRWDAVIMADYCWSLKGDNPAAAHTRESKKRRFMPQMKPGSALEREALGDRRNNDAHKQDEQKKKK
uniref:Uncharacterized protein n=1 Tax=Knipowitschia caucasica TaxID=637954 RepID=A0AAV2MH85_KNICA